MAAVTYLVRMLPLVLARNKIENRFLKSFLYYMPYACLTAMTIPAIFYATSSIYSAILGLIAACVIAYKNGSLLTVASVACIVVFISERLFLL